MTAHSPEWFARTINDRRRQMTLEQIKHSIDLLSPEEREELLEHLNSIIPLTEIEKEWATVCEARYQEYLRDPSTATPADVVFRELREKYGLND
jgi:putative addiction module component (TIGR02574 family)